MEICKTNFNGGVNLIEFLKRYQIKLEVLTPIFIGSGLELNKKEYIYYRNNYEAWIPNKVKLFKSIMENHLVEQYEQYMLNGKEPLLNWMKSVGYSDKEIKGLCDYFLDCAYALENLNRPIGISEFMKDPYGLPYVPGSSIKGAIRSALLGNRILVHPEKYGGICKSAFECETTIKGRPNKRYLMTEGKKVEEVGFHVLEKTEKVSNARNDELKGLIVGDSKPLNLNDLTLCQKVDVRLDGKKNSLNTLRECLKPGTVVEFDMTVDTTVLNLSIEEIEKALTSVFQFYQEMYVKKFTEISDRDCGNLYLGGGSGYGTKTVAYELLDDWNRMKMVGNLMDIRFPKHGHRSDAKKGVSPHTLKCTKYGGKLVEMGKCRMEIQEIS